MYRRLLPFALSLLALTSSAFAQTAGDATAPNAMTPEEAVRRMSVPAPPQEAAQGPSLKARVGRMFTGAVVGGWLGFFTSQVAVSDWDTRSGITTHRGAWAAGGMALGAFAGHLVTGGRKPPAMRPDVASARQVITREEINGAGAANAYELVRSLRKEWLMPRGLNSFRESARGSADFGEEMVVVPGADHVIVYLDNARLGGTQYLAEVALETIGRVEFIEPSQATFRWGTGHAHGVILVTTMGFEVKR
jgi:hypothetical protein